MEHCTGKRQAWSIVQVNVKHGALYR